MRKGRRTYTFFKKIENIAIVSVPSKSTAMIGWQWYIAQKNLIFPVEKQAPFRIIFTVIIYKPFAWKLLFLQKISLTFLFSVADMP